MKKQSGFTLLEIMVVVVIMGMLASIVSFNVMGSKADAEIRKSKIDIKNIQQSIERRLKKSDFWLQIISRCYDLILRPQMF